MQKKETQTNKKLILYNRTSGLSIKYNIPEDAKYTNRIEDYNFSKEENGLIWAYITKLGYEDFRFSSNIKQIHPRIYITGPDDSIGTAFFYDNR